MLSLNKVLEQLNDAQLLKLEGNLQKRVSYNSQELLVFNCAMLGQTEEETLTVCGIGKKNYVKYARTVYKTIEDLFDMKPKSIAERLFTEVHYAIYQDTYPSDMERAKKCELLFHRLKREELEQESYPLLYELHQLHIGSPLEAVYEHLYKKYLKICRINRNAFEVFEAFNLLFTEYIHIEDSVQANEVRKEMIRKYKKLRSLQDNPDYANNTLKSLLLLTKLSLVKVCHQKQLLFDSGMQVDDLEYECGRAVKRLPYGMENFLLSTLFNNLEQLNLDDLPQSADEDESEPQYFNFPSLAELIQLINNKKRMPAFSPSSLLINREKHQPINQFVAIQRSLSKKTSKVNS